MSELIQALSRLAGNRQSDGTSSLITAADRSIIIDGCYELMLAARQAPTPAELMTVDVEPVAWRWTFDGGCTWHYGADKPGKFRFGGPDIIEPMYRAALTASEGSEG